MTITFNCTGNRRKELVKAIKEITGTESRYLGAPSFAYEIGEYKINKDGNIECVDGTNTFKLVEALSSRGFEPEQFDAEETADMIEDTAEAEETQDTAEQDEPVKEAANSNEENSEPEDSDNNGEEDNDAKTVKSDNETEEHEESAEAETEILESASEGTKLTLSLPADLFDERIFNNLNQILENHHDIFCHALKTDSLDYSKGDEQIDFPWFTLEEDGDAQVYTEFLSGLLRMATDAKRVNKKSCITDNEKFAMRCYLIRMGFNGDEYKKLRKVMIKHLTGNSAFRNGRPGGENNDTEQQ